MDAHIIKRYIDYLQKIRLFKPKSITEYRRALNYLCSETDPLSCESSGEVRAHLLRMKEKFGYGESSAAKYSKIIKNFYSWSTSERLIPYNPYPFSEFKKPRETSPDFLTEEQFKQIIESPHAMR